MKVVSASVTVALLALGATCFAADTPSMATAALCDIIGDGYAYNAVQSTLDAIGYNTSYRWFHASGEARGDDVADALQRAGILIFHSHGFAVGDADVAIAYAAADNATYTDLDLRDSFVSEFRAAFSGATSGYQWEQMGSTHYLCYKRSVLGPSALSPQGGALVCQAVCYSSRIANAWGSTAVIRSNVNGDIGSSTMASKISSALMAMSQASGNRTAGLAADYQGLVCDGAGGTVLYPTLVSRSPESALANTLWTDMSFTFDCDVAIDACPDPACNGRTGITLDNGGWLAYVAASGSSITCKASAGVRDVKVVLHGSTSDGYYHIITSASNGTPFNAGNNLELTYSVPLLNPAADIYSFSAIRSGGGAEVELRIGRFVNTERWDVLRVAGPETTSCAVITPATLPPDGMVRVWDGDAASDGQYILRETESGGRTLYYGPAYEPGERQQREARVETVSGRRAMVSPRPGEAQDGSVKKTAARLVILTPDQFVGALAPYVAYWSGQGYLVSVSNRSSWTQQDVQACIDAEYAGGARYFQLVGSYSDHEWFDDIGRWPDNEEVEEDWRFFYYYDRATRGWVSHPEWDIMPTCWYEDTAIDNWSFWFPYYSCDTGYVSGKADAYIARFPAYAVGDVSAWVQKTLTYNQEPPYRPWAQHAFVAVESSENANSNLDAMANSFVDNILLPLFPEEVTAHVVRSRLGQSLTRAAKTAAFNSEYNEGRAVIVIYGTLGTEYRLGNYVSTIPEFGWTLSSWNGGTLPFLLGATCASVGWSGVQADTSGQSVTRQLYSDPSRGFVGAYGPRTGSDMVVDGLMAGAVLANLYGGEPRSIAQRCMDAVHELAMQQPAMANYLESYTYEGCVLTRLKEPVVPTDASDEVERSGVVGMGPNPCNGAIRVEYLGASDEVVRMRIFDARGRFVQEIVSGPQDAGRRWLNWDTRDDAGRSCASGIYFIRVEGDGGAQVVRVALVR